MTPETKIELMIGIALVVGVSAVLSVKSCAASRDRGTAVRSAASGQRAGLQVGRPGEPDKKPAASGAVEKVEAVGQPPAAAKPAAAADAPRPTPLKPEQPKPAPAKAEPAAPPGEAVSVNWEKDLADGQALVVAEKFAEAWPVLTRALLATPEGDKRESVKKALDKAVSEMVFSPRPTADSVVHTVAQGDSYWSLAQKYNIHPDLIKWTNQKSSDNLRLGERLKVLQGAWAGVVQKSAFRLLIFFNGNFVKEYAVGIGRYDKTPAAVFEIDNKMEKPTWYAPDGVYPFGHPKNILGTRWLGFKETTEFHGYGIHGCDDPSTIGKAASNGCIRMKNLDVEEVYKLLKKGDKVRIVP